jgi:hypothetical protein
MASYTFPPPPIKDGIAQSPIRGRDGLPLTEPWEKWLNQLTLAIGSAPLRRGSVSLSAQSASIGATAIPAGALAAGTYRVSYYARVTTAAATSSSLTVTLAWTDGGVAQSAAGAAMTGNSTTTNQTGSVLISVDAGSSITYETTYASNGAGEMRYALTVLVEQVLL